MNSTIFLRSIRLISIIAFLGLGASRADACGPYNPIIPTPNFFFTDATVGRVDSDRRENLGLWQQLTSDQIPLADIEQAVYKDPLDTYQANIYDRRPVSNLFYAYLRNSNDDELIEFLSFAKSLEEKRAEMASPWYYPSSKDRKEEKEWFKNFIETARNYKGTRLKDRYALQAVRAYFAEGELDSCINYYEKAFVDFPDSNLFKRMAAGYAAGCLERKGNQDAAIELYATAGDFGAIAAMPKGLEYMARANPDSPELMEYIAHASGDTAAFMAIEPVALNVLKDGKTTHPADWEFILAFINGEYKNDYKTAATHIYRAMEGRFSRDAFADYARAYRAKVDAANGNTTSLLDDLKWFETKINLTDPGAKEWNRRMQNIVFINWIPTLWKKGDYATAILLCGYADNLLNTQKKFYCEDFDRNYEYNPNQPNQSQTLAQMRASTRYRNTVDYSNLAFQLMGSLNAEQLIAAKKQISQNTPLYSLLRQRARIDDPYWDELIGTLALREENYDLAMEYLGRVPNMYQWTMNIYKEKDLNRDPFKAYPSRWEKHKYDGHTWESESRSYRAPLATMDNAKYNFAKQMAQYKQQMTDGKTADERGLARLKYAIGRRNSFEECWALTQYWRGYTDYRFTPQLQYWNNNDDATRLYDFLYDYETKVGHKTIWAKYNKEERAALKMLQTPEARAEAQYLLGNLATVIKKYPDTPTAAMIKTSCDNWRSWL
ncbi:MAG: hypothetical protein J1E63_03375 [Muribaculaceae bacterium]|nr:hypothetical protein [Muribaculaceae bacterium]